MSEQWQTAQRPAAIRVINGFGRLSSAIGLAIPSITLDSILNAAIKQTRLRDLGDESCLIGLRHLVDGLNHEAKLTQIGRISARDTLVRSVVNRLQILDYVKKNPDVRDEEIREPIFIAGLPRTGTTILHLLMAEDPNHRAPLMWQMQRPFPKPTDDERAHLSAIREVEKGSEQLDMLSPGFKAIHESEARLPEECISAMTSAFFQEQFSTVFHLPSYRAWYMNADALPAYQWHKLFLQYMQHKRPKRRWILKSPLHLPFLETILHVYPDARIIQTHRNPMEVMASTSSLLCTLRSAFSDDVQPKKIGSQETEFFAEVLRRGAQQRTKLAVPPRFYDMQFSDMIHRPIDAILDAYKYFGLPYSGDLRTLMKDYLEKRPRDKHGGHNYSLATFGLSIEKHGPLFEQSTAV